MCNKTSKITPIWRSIALSLRDELAEGHYTPGDKLPTEAQFAERFGVNRHTVRRALSDLMQDGLLRSRRGSGVFVTARPTDYPIGRRVRFHENLLAAGHAPEKRLLNLETRAPSPGEATALDNPSRVCVYYGLSLSDRQPIAVFQSVFPLDRLPGIDTALQETASVTAALQAVGVKDYTRLSTRLTAVRATATQALHLHLNEGEPLLRSTGVNVDTDGIPVEYGKTYFAGDRVTLTLEGDGR